MGHPFKSELLCRFAASVMPAFGQAQ